MSKANHSVNKHYGVGGILNAILETLTAMGKDIEKLKPIDLAPVDQFHLRGRQATIELADRAGVNPGLRILDVGCGIGGSVRYLAAEYGCRATGIDLTEEYIEVASALARLVGLENQVDFHACSALNLPFDNNTFDIVWTEHIQMNIEDKATFYQEMARVVKPGGRLVFHDIFLGDGRDLFFPVPWAEDNSINFLISPNALIQTLERSGFQVRDWEDKSKASVDWYDEFVEKTKTSGPVPLGVHLLMGENAKEKLHNMIRNIREGRIVVILAVVEKS